uniref:Hydrophobic protein OSR8 n=1 Tax=Aegilops tauschii subsp. strangulata TaxID=200361 RepID=A0A453LM71_AEGTS
HHHNLCNKVSSRPSFPDRATRPQTKPPDAEQERGREREREISITDGVPELHLPGDPARRHPAAARRLPPLRLLEQMEFLICLLLTILGYIPGIIYAVYVLVAHGSASEESGRDYDALA